MKNYKFLNKSVYLEKEKILVIADLHLGYEEYLKERGVFLPRFQYKKITEDLEEIFGEINKLENRNSINNKKPIKKEKTQCKNVKSLVINNKDKLKARKIKEIIILGDLKHEFAGILEQEWKETLALLDFLKKKTRKIILIRGNHDNYLVNVVKKKGIKLKDFYIKDNLAFVHGNKLFPEILDKKVNKIFLGHIHPAISIRKGVKSEIYKCFLVGKFKGKEVIILPSFFPLVEGADVSVEDTNLGFKLDLREFEVFVPIPKEVLKLGKVKNIGKLVG